MNVGRPRSLVRRIERWVVGLVMAALVFVLERLVIRQVEKKEAARGALPATALTVGEE